jgi:hypothetical protein
VAIAELNKMEGDYAATKAELVVTEKPIDLSNLTDEQLRLLAEIQSQSGISQA